MVGAIGSLSGYDSIFSIGYSARAAATNTDFKIPASALTGPEAAEGVAATPAHDPIQDSVELSRDFPQLVVGQTYAPPMEQQIAFAIRGSQQPAGMSSSEEESSYLNDTNLLYTGSDVQEDGSGDIDGEEVTVEGGEKAETGEDGEEKAKVDETGTEQKKANGQPMSEDEQQQVKELAKTDREVRAHEQAHKSVGGAHAGAMSFGYEQGPDGQRYAVSGEVSIDISSTNDPSETINKMQQVRAAAMAPANPSPQDYKVAAQAMQQEAQARQEMGTGGAEGASEGEGSEESEGVQGLGERQGGEGESSEDGGLGGVNSMVEGGNGSSSSNNSSSVSGSTGGVASLRSNNQFAQRYAQMQMAPEQASTPFHYGSSQYSASMMNGSYRPINIVA